MEPIHCPETSVHDYHSTLRDIPEQRRSHQHRGGNMKSQISYMFQPMLDHLQARTMNRIEKDTR
jgi:hypothetical protein